MGGCVGPAGEGADWRRRRGRQARKAVAREPALFLPPVHCNYTWSLAEEAAAGADSRVAGLEVPRSVRTVAGWFCLPDGQ